MNKNRLFILLVFLLIQAQLVWVYTEFNSSRQEIVVVDLEDLFEEFDYKEELELEVKAIDKKQTMILDSLESNIKKLSLMLKSSESEIEKEELTQQLNRSSQIYRSKNEAFKNALNEVIQSFDEKIWNQLQAYSDQYCAENGFQIVIGKDDNNVLYKSDQRNITPELIQYINQKFAGK